MAASSKNEKQVMDVSKPGKSAPDSSAKPVIVGHKPQVQDPMVTSETNPEAKNPESDASAVEVTSPSASKKVITPIEEDSKEVESEAPTEKEEPPEPEKNTETVPDEQPVEEQSTDNTESAVVDAVAEQVANKPKEEQAISEEERKKQEEIAKLVAEKKYFVPLGKTHGRSNKGIFIITASLLVIFIGLVLAIDAEILDAGFSLPFDLL